MNGQDLLNFAQSVDQAIQGQLGPQSRQRASSLSFWAALNLGASRLGVGLIDRLSTTDGIEEVQRLLADEPFDVLEALALATTARSVVAALDLCAGAIYHLTEATGLQGGREVDLGWWTVKRIMKNPPAIAQAGWIWGVRTAGEWKLLERVRHGTTHRDFPRTIMLNVGSRRVPIDEINVDGTLHPIDELVRLFHRWGVERYVDFCRGVIATFS